jgi:hypothetical protein
MRLRLLVANGLVLGAVAWMATLGGIETNAAELLPRKKTPSMDMAALESQAAIAHDARSVAALAGAYLDRGQPGLATAAIEHASPEIQSRPEVAQLHARALFHRGRVRQALAVARDAADACSDAASCPPWLLAKTARQVAFFEQVVAAGIDDPNDNPEATRAAYERSAREVRLVAMR